MAEKNGITGSMQSVTGSKSVLYTDDIKFNQGTWWQRRSGLEKKLVFLLVVCFLVALVFFIVLLVLATRTDTSTRPEVVVTTPKPSEPEICTTPGCVTAAARILDYADLTADPCENFYDYACGSYMKKTAIAEDRLSNEIFYVLIDQLDIKIRAVLDAPNKESEPSSTAQARILFNACVDDEEQDRRGPQPLLDFLPNIGGWPLLDPSWTDSSFQLEEALIKLVNYNMVPLIHISVRNDLGNSSQYRIYFDQPGLGMPDRDYYLRGRNESKLQAYEKLMNDVAVAAGADPAFASSEIADVIDFEIELANITVPKVERMDNTKLYNLYSLRDMAQNYSDFDWTRFTRAVIEMGDDGVTDITDDEVVVNWSPPYFENIFPLLRNTPKRVVANYMTWMMVKRMITAMGTKFRDMNTEYKEELYGTTSEPERWKSCLKYINSVMSMTIARLFTDTYFDENSKSAMLELISYLRESFNELLEEADWMDEPTRVVAREKAAFMTQKIGYPDVIKNNTYLDDLYKKYIFNETTYFGDVLLIMHNSAAKSIGRLRKAVDKSEWIVQPAIVNAFYYPSWNEIIFPAGILQPPFYSNNQPWSLNFGAIGGVIGHEITHGFDNRGRQTDKYGNLREWWDPEVIERFKNESNCFVEQTSRFVVPEAGMNINGKLTVGEDIADNGGVKQSFNAYRKFISKRGKEEPRLPGLPLTHNQLFFMSWGQVWCTKIRPAASKNYILTSYHSPNRYRATGPMMNSPDFAKAFNCKKDAPMNPTEKCSLW